VKGEWVWGEIFGGKRGGGNEIDAAPASLFSSSDLCIKKKEKAEARCDTCHITFVITVASRRLWEYHYS
jgi:hypothetical protein